MPRKGGWRDLCDVCKTFVPRETLVYRDVVWKHPVSQNHLPFSEYDAVNWTAEGPGSYQANDSWGAFPQKRTLLFVPQQGIGVYTREMPLGVARFRGMMIAFPNDGVDCSLWNQFLFWVFVGPDENSLAPSLEVMLGLMTPGDIATAVPFLQIATRGQRKLWFQTTPDEVSASGLDPANVAPFIAIFPETDTSDWFFEMASVQRDVTAPMASEVTAGSSIIYATDTPMKGIAKCCPKCREDIPTDVEKHPPFRDDFGEDRYESLQEIPEESG